jgi:predicted RNA binding protein YcfA (HicA-like mRNA interferase family)
VPRIGALSPRAVLRMLRDAGFVVDHQTGSHVVLYQASSGRRIVVPVHSRSLPRGTLLAILKQAGLSPD